MRDDGWIRDEKSWQIRVGRFLLNSWRNVLCRIAPRQPVEKIHRIFSSRNFKAHKEPYVGYSWLTAKRRDCRIRMVCAPRCQVLKSIHGHIRQKPRSFSKLSRPPIKNLLLHDISKHNNNIKKHNVWGGILSFFLLSIFGLNNTQFF